MILVSIASDRPLFTLVVDPGSRHRVSALGRIHSMVGRPMSYLEDGMSGFKQSEANAPRMRIVIAPSRAGSAFSFGPVRPSHALPSGVGPRAYDPYLVSDAASP